MSRLRSRDSLIESINIYWVPIIIEVIIYTSLFLSLPTFNPLASNLFYSLGFANGSDGKASVCNEGDPGSIPGLGRSPGEGNGSPLQYSCLENSMNHGAW